MGIVLAATVAKMRGWDSLTNGDLVAIVGRVDDPRLAPPTKAAPYPAALTRTRNDSCMPFESLKGRDGAMARTYGTSVTSAD